MNLLLNQSNLLNQQLDIKKYNLLYQIERECTIYNFLRKKHYKEILESVIRNKLPKTTQNEYKKYLERKDPKTYIVKPLVWIKQPKEDSFKPRERYFILDRIQIDNNTSYILVNEQAIPFYLLKKYGRKKGLELEIFSELKTLKKEIKNHYKTVVEKERKKSRKERKKYNGTRKSS